MKIKYEDLVSALAAGVCTDVRCPNCRGTGTIYAGGKSKRCPVCEGKRKVLVVPVAPVLLPLTEELKKVL